MFYRRVNKKGSPHLSQIFWYVFSSIWFNKLLFVLNVLILGIAALQLDVMSYIAASIYQDSLKTIESSNLGRRIIASCPVSSILEESMRFTASLAEELELDPMIDKAVPVISQGATFQIENRNSFNAQFEGAVLEDPEFSSRRMIWGRKISSLDCQEIVLTETLFNMLYRQTGQDLSISPDSEFPEFVSLEVSRTIDGDHQTLKRDYRFVGILESPSYYAYLPFKQAQYIDMWTSNQIDNFPSTEEDSLRVMDPRGEVDSVFAFVTENVSQSRLQTIQNHFGIEMFEKSRIEYFSDKVISQLRISKPEGSTFGFEDIPATGFSFRFEPVSIKYLDLKSGKSATVLVVNSNDSRLGGLQTESGENVAELIRDLASVIVTPKFLDSFGLTEISSRPIFSLKDGPWETKLFARGILNEESLLTGFDILCSNETFQYIQYEVEVKQATLLFTRSRNVSSAFKLNRQNLIYRIHEPLTAFFSSRSDNYFAFISCFAELDEVLDFCQKSGVTDFIAVPISIVGKTSIPGLDIRDVAIADPKLLARFNLGWVSQYQNLGDDQAMIRYNYFISSMFNLDHLDINNINFSIIEIKGDPFPDNLVFIAATSLSKRDIFFGLEKSKRFSFDYNAIDILLDNPWHYKVIQDLFINSGFEVSCLIEPSKEIVVCYESRGVAGKKLNRQLVNSLRADKTFLDVFPKISAKAKVIFPSEENETVFFASHENDWQRYLYVPFLAGEWFKDGKEEVVLPISAIGTLDPKSVIGTKVLIRFEKPARQSNVDLTMEINCRVSGIIEGQTGYLPINLCENISLWQSGRIKYTNRQGFVSALEIESLSGRNSCKIFINKLDYLEPVVKKLRSRGYLTEDFLGVQQGVNRLGRALTLLVTMLVAGCIIGAFVSVTITTLMNTKKNLYETAGILPSLGGSRSLIFRIFSIYALILGLTSYTLAMIGSFFIVELIKTLIKSVSTFPIDEVVRYHLFSPQFIWVHIMVLVVVFIFCFVGIWVSVVFVYLTPISEAFGNKDQ